VWNALHEYRSTFCIVDNSTKCLELDNSEKETHCCVAVAKLNGFILLAATCRLTIKGKTQFRFSGNSRYANALRCYVTGTWLILLYLASFGSST
jgi:hypothetical protein